MNRAANRIAQRTRRGAGNWAVVSPAALTVLQSASTSAFARTTEGSFEAPVNQKMVGTLNGALKHLEEVLLDSVTLQGYSSLGNRQNNFAFSKLYFFLLWARAKAINDKSTPETFLEMDKQLREEMIITFAALIWADDYVDSTEQQVIEKYIKQTKLTEAKQNKLNQRILELSLIHI